MPRMFLRKMTFDERSSVVKEEDYYRNRDVTFCTLEPEKTRYEPHQGKKEIQRRLGYPTPDPNVVKYVAA